MIHQMYLTLPPPPHARTRMFPLIQARRRTCDGHIITRFRGTTVPSF